MALGTVNAAMQAAENATEVADAATRATRESMRLVKATMEALSKLSIKVESTRSSQ